MNRITSFFWLGWIGIISFCLILWMFFAVSPLMAQDPFDYTSPVRIGSLHPRVEPLKPSLVNNALTTTIPADLPNISVSFATDEVGEGYIFLSPHERRVGSSPYDPYLMIVDNKGELVYHRKVDYVNHTRFDDFKKLDDKTIVSWVGGLGQHELQDTTYEVVDIIKPVGYGLTRDQYLSMQRGHHQACGLRGRYA